MNRTNDTNSPERTRSSLHTQIPCASDGTWDRSVGNPVADEGSETSGAERGRKETKKISMNPQTKGDRWPKSETRIHMKNGKKQCKFIYMDLLSSASCRIFRLRIHTFSSLSHL